MYVLILLACTLGEPRQCAPIRPDPITRYATEAQCMASMDAVVSGWQMRHPVVTVELAGCGREERRA